MFTVALWPATLEALQALARHYGPEMDRAAVEMNLSDRYGWLLPALVFEPEPISAGRLRLRSPYTSARLCIDRLENAARGGFLAPLPEAENEYRLTGLGRQAANRVIEAAYTKMAQLQPLPLAELARLADLLNEVVICCLDAPEPPGKWCLSHSRRTDPGEEVSVVVRIDQYLSDLAAYRDDAHLASWQPHDLEGHVWETLTCLWWGETNTFVGLFEKLERHGYSPEEYKQALENLIQRGWVEETDREYHLTSTGESVRELAEEATDRYFYAPWSCLSPAETETLQTLLVGFRNGLRLEA
jgi:hypothetical protein